MHTLKSLVVVINGEPLASTSTIAGGMRASHKNVLALVRKHGEVLARFGGVAFETRPFATRGGTQQREVAMLNERQAALLISLMRNSDEVVTFKANLISEFYRMRDALDQRTHNLWQQMQALIAREVKSEVRASFGSHLMLERKREIPAFSQERTRLEHEIQPSLLTH